MRTVTVSVFPGGSNWPLFVAEELGFFEREDIAVHVMPATSSAVQRREAADGIYDIVHTAFDNVLGWAPAPEPPDIVAVMGGNGGLLRLMCGPAITNIRDLRGKRLGVDSVSSGYAFVLYAMLESAGIARDDCTFISAGSSGRRVSGLLAGDFEAALISVPFDLELMAKGMRNLGDAFGPSTHYQGYVAAASRKSLADNEDALLSYIRTYITASNWLFDRANRPRADAILAANTGLQGRDIRVAGDALLSVPEGIDRYSALDREGCGAVWDLRRRFGDVGLQSVNSYIDETGYQKASDTLSLP